MLLEHLQDRPSLCEGDWIWLYQNPNGAGLERSQGLCNPTTKGRCHEPFALHRTCPVVLNTRLIERRLVRLACMEIVEEVRRIMVIEWATRLELILLSISRVEWQWGFANKPRGILGVRLNKDNRIPSFPFTSQLLFVTSSNLCPILIPSALTLMPSKSESRDLASLRRLCRT